MFVKIFPGKKNSPFLVALIKSSPFSIHPLYSSIDERHLSPDIDFPPGDDDNSVGAENKRASRHVGANSENELFPNSTVCKRRRGFSHHVATVVGVSIF